MATNYNNYSNTDKLAMIAAEVEYLADNGGGGGGGGSLPNGGSAGQALIKKSDKNGDAGWKSIGQVEILTKTQFQLKGVNTNGEQSDVLTISKASNDDYLRFLAWNRSENSTTFDEYALTKKYADDNLVSQADLTTVQDNLQGEIDALGEPFRVKHWIGDPNITIQPCTTDLSNGDLSKMVFRTEGQEAVDYQIVGMIAYEMFDATSGGARINCWPVCQFTGQNQTELSVRWVCAGSNPKTARRISAWVLLKHR